MDFNNPDNPNNLDNPNVKGVGGENPGGAVRSDTVTPPAVPGTPDLPNPLDQFTAQFGEPQNQSIGEITNPVAGGTTPDVPSSALHDDAINTINTGDQSLTEKKPVAESPFSTATDTSSSIAPQPEQAPETPAEKAKKLKESVDAFLDEIINEKVAA